MNTNDDRHEPEVVNSRRLRRPSRPTPNSVSTCSTAKPSTGGDVMDPTDRLAEECATLTGVHRQPASTATRVFESPRRALPTRRVGVFRCACAHEPRTWRVALGPLECLLGKRLTLDGPDRIAAMAVSADFESRRRALSMRCVIPTRCAYTHEPRRECCSHMPCDAPPCDCASVVVHGGDTR